MSAIRTAGSLFILRKAQQMRVLVNILPVLIIVAFPILYSGASTGDETLSLLVILTLLAGMSGPILKNMK